MRCIVFGVGNIYRQIKEELAGKVEIVALLDNSMERNQECCDGVKIYLPSELPSIDYDYIILASIYATEMRTQLLELGYPKNRIVHYDEFMARLFENKIVRYSKADDDIKSEKCLIITSDLDYHGGAIVAMNTAVELMARGYHVTLAAPKGNNLFIEALIKKEIAVIIYSSLKYAKHNEMEWLQEYDYLVVNTLPMILCAIEISKIRKVSLWLHEATIEYQFMSYWKKEISEGIENKNLKLYAVSKIAKDNFCNHIREWEINSMPFGIMDFDMNVTAVNEKLTIASIGAIHPIKGQDILIQAINRLDANMINTYLIGKDADSSYRRKLDEYIRNDMHITFIPPQTQEQLREMYKDIDIIIVASRQETMSIVAIEAMLQKKVCIVSSGTGIAEYISHGDNGFVFQNEDVEELCETIKWCVEHKESLKEIGVNARKTYEEFFSMKVFGDRLVNEMLVH